MKRFNGLLVLLLIATVLFTGCAKQTAVETEVAPEETVEAVEKLAFPLTLRVGYSTGPDDPRGVAIKHMKERVEAETDGQILLEIHPAGELGSDDQLIAGLIDGSVDITVSSAGNYALYATKMGVSALPFLFADFQSAWSFIDSDTMKGICGDLEAYNMHVLAFFDNGFRCVTTTDRPVENVKDMEGLVIRTPDNQIVMETMYELGARPKSYPFAKLKEALVNGEFDAQENPIPVIYNNGLYEVQHYLSITNHSYDAMPLTIRRDIWERLPERYKDVILSAAEEAQTINREMVAEQTEDYVALLEEKGMVVQHPDPDEFIGATRGVMDVFANVYGDELLKEIEEFRSREPEGGQRSVEEGPSSKDRKVGGKP